MLSELVKCYIDVIFTSHTHVYMQYLNFVIDLSWVMNSTKQTRTNHDSEKKKKKIDIHITHKEYCLQTRKLLLVMCYFVAGLFFSSVLVGSFQLVKLLTSNDSMEICFTKTIHNKAKNLQLSTWRIHGFKIELWHDDERSV